MHRYLKHRSCLGRLDKIQCPYLSSPFLPGLSFAWVKTNAHRGGIPLPQIFQPKANTLARIIVYGVIFIILAVVGFFLWLWRSSYTTGVGVAVPQPVPFSHKHHVGGLGIDCRYCHTSVEQSAFAGIPATEICMTCHSQLWTNAQMLAPVRESLRTGRPLHWVRVHDLPDFVYFNHSIHVHKGVGCVTCHGRVDTMPLIRKVNTLHMAWCLDCHRAPERYLRPREKVFDLTWQPEGDQLELGRRLMHAYNIQVKSLTDCYRCHR